MGEEDQEDGAPTSCLRKERKIGLEAGSTPKSRVETPRSSCCMPSMPSPAGTQLHWWEGCASLSPQPFRDIAITVCDGGGGGVGPVNMSWGNLHSSPWRSPQSPELVLLLICCSTEILCEKKTSLDEDSEEAKPGSMESSPEHLPKISHSMVTVSY